MDFIDFVAEKIDASSDEPFDFERMNDTEATKELIEQFTSYMIFEKEPLRKDSGALKRQREHPVATEEMRAVARNSMSAATVKSALQGTIVAVRQVKSSGDMRSFQFRFLTVVDPDNGGRELLSDGQIQMVASIMERHIGVVKSYETRPVFVEDIRYAVSLKQEKTLGVLKFSEITRESGQVSPNFFT